jgi:hypothetical protein
MARIPEEVIERLKGGQPLLDRLRLRRELIPHGATPPAVSAVRGHLFGLIALKVYHILGYSKRAQSSASLSARLTSVEVCTPRPAARRTTLAKLG